ncbi:MAG: twin-arginine translocase subunit TatB [Candidatus Abyssobacteria bacterium SURF_17]|jgi:Tat protein translocase TatB subunit|uniref:Twin-arginine translocase subunit TatB n=1 Tax=Candidatus Abyssobacteria bacterium SURF_17 TaxID=2093361 RepID=A0A419F076_9BACT|nr:MAG: twin-arginine translocase subunit TatB [Candidatus Abyssubacteria bacterium SURF_17]
MMGIGPAELILILVVTLIVLGPEKMPEIARALARLMRDLRHAMDEVRDQFDEMTREDLLGTKDIDNYYRETVNSVKKSIEAPPEVKKVGKEIEDSMRQIEKPTEDEPSPKEPPTQPSP